MRQYQVRSEGAERLPQAQQSLKATAQQPGKAERYEREALRGGKYAME